MHPELGCNKKQVVAWASSLNSGTQKKLPLLITGCGRSGTKYISFVLQLIGLDIPHERLGKDGIASWTMAVNAEFRPFGPPSSQVCFDQVFHQVRDPLAVIASCTTFKEESWDFISEISAVPRQAPILLRAAQYWLIWNELAERVATWRYRVEDFYERGYLEFSELLRINIEKELLHKIGFETNTRAKGNIYHFTEECFRRQKIIMPRAVKKLLPSRRNYCPITWHQLRSLDADLCARVQAKALAYGYSDQDVVSASEVSYRLHTLSNLPSN